MPKHRKNRNWKTRNQINGFQRGYYDAEQFNCSQNFNYSQFYNDRNPNQTSMSSCGDMTKVEKNVELNLTPETPGTSDEVRTIKREALHKNPEVQSYIHDNRYINYKLSILRNDVKYWKREQEEPSADEPEKTKSRKKNDNRKNEFEKKLNKMLEKPAEISKGKSMLEKMGWTGGGLGKDGAGILEPIAPKAKYATKTFGLGHVTEPDQVEVRDDNLEFNNNFRTNVLLIVLDFIKNDLEVDILFDVALWRCERKRIHNIVLELGKCTSVEELAYDNPIDTAIAGDIIKRNMYLLLTKSLGKSPNRQLCLYKDAPQHIYLIIPDDLKDVIVIETRTKNKFVHNKKQSEIEKFTNQVKALQVKNFGKNLKQLNKQRADIPKNISGKLVAYFKEFSNNRRYTEFRLLGPFDNEERDAINAFNAICLKRDSAICEERDELLEALNDDLFEFDVKEYQGGRIVIYKRERTYPLQPKEITYI